jgi:signal transduction histidine kinase
MFAICFSWAFLYNSTLAALFASKRILLLLSPSFVCIVLAMGGFITLSMHLLMISIVSSAAFIIVNSIREYRRGNPNAGIFLVAWLGLLVGCSIFSLRGMGVTPSNLFTTNSIWVGSGFECLLLVIALIEKSRQHREEAQLATQRAMVLLEEKVAQRTRELANTQEKLVQSEKMAALGVFTAGMAHEINNPANFVSGGVQNAAAATDRFENFVSDLLEQDADAEITAGFSQYFTKLRTQHELIRTGVDRITTIVTRLRATHPEGETGFMPVNLAELTGSVWSLIESQLRIPVTFKCQIKGDVLVPGLAAELQQALLAILGNAVLAIEDAHRSRGEGYTGLLDCRIQHLEDHTVRWVLADNGIGIPAGLLDRVFDPFFTTREIGKGAGLGLSMTRNIIEKHCGWISLENTEGQGTRVVVTLPSA